MKNCRAKASPLDPHDSRPGAISGQLKLLQNIKEESVLNVFIIGHSRATTAALVGTAARGRSRVHVGWDSLARLSLARAARPVGAEEVRAHAVCAQQRRQRRGRALDALVRLVGQQHAARAPAAWRTRSSPPTALHKRGVSASLHIQN